MPEPPCLIWAASFIARCERAPMRRRSSTATRRLAMANGGREIGRVRPGFGGASGFGNGDGWGDPAEPDEIPINRGRQDPATDYGCRRVPDRTMRTRSRDAPPTLRQLNPSVERARRYERQERAEVRPGSTRPDVPARNTRAARRARRLRVEVDGRARTRRHHPRQANATTLIR